MTSSISSGANYTGNGKCQFCVWAPLAEKVEVHVVAPGDRLISMQKGERGYHHVQTNNIKPGTLYFYRLDGGKEVPDPASRSQPQGVHGPSEAVDLSFGWKDDQWQGLPLKDYVIYELHVGAFTEDGTFESIIPHLAELKELGITAVELMPVAQFPGNRNWGYDGVYPYAVHNSYGGYQGLQRLVDACHNNGMAIILDVVYNHLGPEGNYFRDYGHYFTNRYATPWGEAINFDGPYSDEVRRFFIENAVYWVTCFHIDALRLDAIHAIMDQSPQTFVEELTTAVHKEAEQSNRRIYVIAESHLNDARLIRSRDIGGYGVDAQWNDDFHHAIHVQLTGEKTGYYEDFVDPQHLAKGFKEGYIYSGEYAPFWLRRRGSSSRDIPGYRFVVFSQNHDQVGNRMLGDRLTTMVKFESLKVAAASVILSPFIPLLFMGEEYAETAHFPYFVSHSDTALIEAVRKGRLAEFDAFRWGGEPPDPQDEETFFSARLNHKLKQEGQHRVLFNFYRELIRLRKEIPALSNLSKDDMEVISHPQDNILLLHRWTTNSQICLFLNFNEKDTTIYPSFPGGIWAKVLDSAEKEWAGPGSRAPDKFAALASTSLTLSPRSVTLYLAT